MTERTATWLMFTCLVGLIPVIARLLLWLLSKEGIEPFATSDLISFGLVLHTVNVNEVNRIADTDTVWKTVHNGLSILFITIYALLLFLTISVPQNIDLSSVLATTFAMGLVSFLLSLSIMTRIQAIERQSGLC